MGKRLKKKVKVTLAETYVRKDVITPEFSAKYGHTLEKVGDHEVTGRGETTIRVRASPLERLYHAGKAITDIQYEAGKRLYELYRATGLDPARATDWTRPYVDGGLHVATPEWNERARSEYARAIKALDNPMVLAVVRAVIIEEQDIGLARPTPYARGSQDGKAYNLAILTMGLDELAIAFGMYKPGRG